MQAPLKIPTLCMLTAMLNNLDYTQGHKQNPVSGQTFSRLLSRLGPGAHLYTPEHSFPPFDSSLEKTWEEKKGVSPAGW